MKRRGATGAKDIRWALGWTAGAYRGAGGTAPIWLMNTLSRTSHYRPPWAASVHDQGGQAVAVARERLRTAVSETKTETTVLELKAKASCARGTWTACQHPRRLVGRD